MTRFLRPAHVVVSGDTAWLVDESWPVAAALVTGRPPALVSWPAPQRRPVTEQEESERVVAADGIGLVVAHGRDVAWVRQDACTVLPKGDGLSLAAADPDAAWLVDRSMVDAGPPPLPLRPGRIVALRRDGVSTEVPTPAPVNAIGVRATDLWVTLADLPVTWQDTRGSWFFDYPSHVLRIGRDRLLTDGLAAAVPADEDVPHGVRYHSSHWLESEPAEVLRDGTRAGGLVWSAGAPLRPDEIEYPALAVGHDPSTAEPVLRVDLGPGIVRDREAVGDEVWLVVARQRMRAAARDRGIDVLAVSASGAVRTVHAANSIDITHLAPALQRPSEDELRAHVDSVRGGLEGLETYWRGAGGVRRPLTAGLTDSAVRVEGEWPDTRVIVTFRHPRRPGLVLRRTLPLFDDLGWPIDYEYAAINLMEDVDTNQLSPADEAVGGVLET